MRIVCGLDVHKDSVFVCILNEKGEKFEAKYGVLTPELEELHQLLLTHEVKEVTMESTSIYWHPIWRILGDIECLKLVNPERVRKPSNDSRCKGTFSNLYTLRIRSRHEDD